jgi:hypothetical protein
MPNPAAARQRRSRARRKAGQTIYRVTVPEHAIAEALIEIGRLSPDEALRRELVERALSRVLVDWAERWTSRVASPASSGRP